MSTGEESMNTMQSRSARRRSACPRALHRPPPQPAEARKTRSSCSHSTGGHRLRSRSTLLVGCALRQSRSAPQPRRRRRRRRRPTAPDRCPSTCRRSGISASMRVRSARTRRPRRWRRAIPRLPRRCSCVSSAADGGTIPEPGGALSRARRPRRRVPEFQPRDRAESARRARPTKAWRASGATGGCRSSRSATPIAPPTTRRSRRRPGTPTARSCRRSATTTTRARPTRRQPARAAGGVRRQQSVLSRVRRRATRRRPSTTCRTALALDPTLTAARNNLALAFAAPGASICARTQFVDAGDRASGALQHRHRLSRGRRRPQRAGRVRRGQQGAADVQRLRANARDRSARRCSASRRQRAATPATGSARQ